MAIAYRGRAQKGSATNSLSVAQADFDVAPVAGDVLVAFVSAYGLDGAYAIGNNAGVWTLRASSETLYNDGVNDYVGVINVYTRAWDSGDTSYSWTTDGAGMTTNIVALSGVDTSNISGGTSINGGAGATSQTIASVSAAVTNCWLAAGAATWGTTTAYSSTGTMTQRATASEASGGPTRAVSATEALTSSGSTGTRTFTAGAAGNLWGSVAIAVRPLVTVVTQPTGSPTGSTYRPFVIPHDPSADHIAQLTDEDDLFTLGAM